MHSIKDIANSLGFTQDQVRNRLDQLGTILDQHIKRGKRNKILFTSTGFQILERAKELEEQGMALRDIHKTLDKELSDDNDSNVEEKVNTNSVQNEYQVELIREKDKRIQSLESQLRYLKGKLDQRDDQIQQLIPGSTDKGEENKLEELSLFQVIKKWLKTEV